MISSYRFYSLKDEKLQDGIDVTNFLIEKVILTEEQEETEESSLQLLSSKSEQIDSLTDIVHECSVNRVLNPQSMNLVAFEAYYLLKQFDGSKEMSLSILNFAYLLSVVMEQNPAQISE